MKNKIEFNNDKDVLETVKNFGSALFMAADRAKDKKDIDLEAIGDFGWILKLSGERLPDSGGVVLATIENGKVILASVNDWRAALKFASERLQKELKEKKT